MNPTAAVPLAVSVVTPCHQGNTWLPLCVNSVADQGPALLEHIVQDTGAAAAIAPALRRHSPVRLFLESDRGMYDALNKGMARVRGDIWGWLNSDEQYLPGVLERVAAGFKARPDLDVLVGDAIVVDGRGHPLCYRKAMLPRRGLIPYITLPLLSCAVFFRRRVLDLGYRFAPDYRVIGDSVWFHGLRAPGVRWHRLREFCAVFTYRADSLGGSAANAEEFRRWRAELGHPWPGARRVLGRVLVNGQRWAEGATRPLDLDYAIHTLDSPERRREFRGRGVPGWWSVGGGHCDSE